MLSKIKDLQIIIFIVFVLNCFTSFSQTNKIYQWTKLGPTDLWAKHGRINFIAIDNQNDSIIYIGTPTSTIWKTENYGDTWFQLAENKITTGVSTIALNPKNSKIIYAGTGDKSGQTYGKEGTGIFKSIDEGENWNNINNNFNFKNIYHIIVNQIDTSIVFVNSSIGFYKSENSGGSWEKIFNQTFRDIKQAPSNENIIYLVSDLDFIKYYVENEEIETYKLDETGNSRIAVSNSNPNIVYLMINNKGLYKSENQGETFVKISNCDYSNFFKLSSYCFCFVASNFNSDVLFLGTRTLWRSLNGGKTWEEKKSLHPDNHFVGFSNSNELFCGNDGGICYSTDSAETWHNLNGNLNISQIYDIASSSDGNTLIIGTQDNGASLLKIENQDTSAWKNIIMADVMKCLIDYSDEKNIFFSNYYPGGQSKLRKTTNYGLTNSIIASPGKKGIDKNEFFHSRIEFVFDKFDSNVMYLGARDLYKSDNINSAEHQIFWKKISDFESNYSISNIEQSSLNQNIAFLSRGLSFLYFSDNFKADSVGWKKISTPIEDINSQIKSIKIHHSNDEIIYIIQGNKLWKSINKGQNWSDISYNLNSILTCIIIDNQQEEDIFLGTSEGIYYKKYNSDYWTKITEKMPDYWITDVEIIYPQIIENQNTKKLNFGKIRAATYGNGVWEAKLLQQTNNQIITLTYDEKSSSILKAKQQQDFNFNFFLSNFYKKNSDSIYQKNHFNYIYKKSFSIEILENQIKIKFNFLNNKEITIFDEKGNSIFDYKTTNQEIEIDFDNYKEGKYYLNIETDDKLNLYQIEIK